jgi:hypothetical protein
VPPGDAGHLDAVGTSSVLGAATAADVVAWLERNRIEARTEGQVTVFSTLASNFASTVFHRTSMQLQNMTQEGK